MSHHISKSTIRIKDDYSVIVIKRHCYTYSERPSLNSGSIHGDITIQTISQQFQSEIRRLNAFNN